MNRSLISAAPDESIQAVLGYLNFSSGAHDPHFFSHLNSLFRYCNDVDGSQTQAQIRSPAWSFVFQLLTDHLALLRKNTSTFENTEQASFVLTATRDKILPGYRKFHADLLFHQSEESLFTSFFVGRVFEAVLSYTSRHPSLDVEWQNEVLDKLNDYVGYRPVAVLENDRKAQPYPHEWCRPTPLFIRGAGVAEGVYTELISQTLDILRTVPPSLYSIAQFDLNNMVEMAIDPRPYDFDHPVNKRPNYQFGMWDPLSVDNRGVYSRFVVQQVTLDILLERANNATEEARTQKMLESAAALAGTILMASTVSGRSPDAYSSDVTLGTLLPIIAECREAFYSHLLGVISKQDVEIAEKLTEEASRLRQPFGGVRHYLNAQLSRRRAQQLEHMHLANVFTKIGRPQAATHQASYVPATSTRILCKLECLLNEIELMHGQQQTKGVTEKLKKAVELLMRGIECGAIVDPWNIIGFDSNFSLFPALENSIPDHRIDLLIEVMNRMFSQFARSLCCAAAGKHSREAKDISSEFKQLSLWWDQFASDSVGDCESVEGRAIYEDSQIAAQALAAWQKLGATSGDVRFWRPFVEQIDSAKGYVLIIDTLLDHRDFVAAMHLMMHWLSQADQINLHKGSDLFHLIANRWLNDVLNMLEHVENAQVNTIWNMVAKFFDFLEANSGIYGQVPKWELINSITDHGEQPFKPEDDPADELYSAAYDEVVYRDSTDDGVEGEILGASADSFGLAEEARRLSERLGFMVTITRLWKHVAVTSVANADDSGESMQSRFASWLSQARDRQKELCKLIKAIERCDLPQPLPTSASLIEYDRNRAIHEVLIERAIDTYLADLETIQSLVAATTQQPSCTDALTEPVACLIRAALKSDVAEARKQVSGYMQDLPQQNFLYIPMAKGGNALTIAQTKGHQRNLKLILDVLPRMGLLRESMMLLQCCAEAERSQAGSSGCVTEFDQMFYVANQQMIAAVVASVSNTTNLQTSEQIVEEEHRDKLLIDYLQQLVGHTSQLWIEHSQTLRLSVLEKVYAEKKWNILVNFIQAHGEDIFTQTFLHLGNLRAILHRGVSLWLEENAASSEEKEWSIYSVMKTDEDKQQIVGHLQVIIEAIVENYGEYREYNGTTTQSDSGELLYAFLDMLRLRSSYDRVAWNLMPAMQVHEILLRYECEAAAEYWRLEMMQRTRETADEMIKKLRELEKRYGMKLSTISDRLEEQFVRPLEVDRTKVLIEKCASNDSRQNEEWFSTLEEQIDELSQEPTGAGLDLPQWIATLEEKVRDTSQNHLRRIREDITQKVPQRILGREELEEQLQGFV